MMSGQYSHQLEFKVRDYECDMQAVVNNGVYQNYLEHARHDFLHSKGINFAEL
ncbi:MAG: acyl-CoA thioesterase, partial [Gammaproteobacteria bacterium]|nr:acyl-CoA thioesterase [Gammaproteobacteria bacterium]